MCGTEPAYAATRIFVILASGPIPLCHMQYCASVWDSAPFKRDSAPINRDSVPIFSVPINRGSADVQAGGGCAVLYCDINDSLCSAECGTERAYGAMRSLGTER
eukprot:3940440-Rhodomonas_salina.2